MSGAPAEASSSESPENVSLPEYLFRNHHTLIDPSKDPQERLRVAQKWESPAADTDAFISVGGPCQGHLPAFDTKTFRKAYTLLFWVRPRLDETNEAMMKRHGEQASLKDDNNVNSGSNHSQSGGPSSYIYRLSTQASDVDATGVCVSCTPWKLIDASDDVRHQGSPVVETMLTAYSLPHHKPSAVQYSSHATYSSFLQTPLRLRVGAWSLVGMTHTFPYLKRPMWTLVVNGAVQDQGPLDYPVTDQVLEYNLFLQNVVAEPLCRLRVDTDNNAADDRKTASELTAPAPYEHVPWTLDWAALSIYPQAISPTLQAVACQAGVATCLGGGGKVLPQLPPIANWTKGSALEGPKVGVPLVVHSAALDLQKAAGSLILAVGAHATRILGGSMEDGSSTNSNQRIVCTHVHVPGDTRETPRVGLVQPQGMLRITEDEAPVYYMVGHAKLYNAVGNLCLQATDAVVEWNVHAQHSNSLNLALQEQNLLSTLVVPFFLALRPPTFDVATAERSHRHLYALLTNDGALAAQLIRNLGVFIRNGGSRVHEQVLQDGIIHVLASSLRLLLGRAYQLNFFDREYPTAAAWVQAGLQQRAAEEAAKRIERPPVIPQLIANACLELVDACCGIAAATSVGDEFRRVLRMDDLEPSSQIQRTCDLALTAVFGLCLDTDLWRNHSEANRAMVAAVADRYGDDCWTGGYLLRSQMSVQFMLDTVRTEPAARILQSMLMSSLSNKRSISQGEHDVSACVGVLCEAQLGTVAAHVVLKGLVYLLVWCDIFPPAAANSERLEHMTDEELMRLTENHSMRSNEGGSGTSDQKMQVASRLGRNLLVANFHDVVGPMLLSRTIFSGAADSVSDKEEKASTWQYQWQMTLLIFSWVASIAGPDGLPPALSTGSLLLASGLAGSLQGAMATADETVVLALYLPPATMALMIGSSLRDEWSYTDLLSDRLQIMMPLLPGMVVSFLPNPTEVDTLAVPMTVRSLHSLCGVLTSVGGTFHRVYGGTIHSTEGAKRQSKRRRDGTSDSIKAARSYVPYFLTIVMLLERQLKAREKLMEDKNEAVAVLRPQTTNGAMRRTDMESWVDVTSESVINEVEVTVYGDDESLENTVETLHTCQRSVLNTACGLVAHAMNAGGAGTSLSLWTAILKTFEESFGFYSTGYVDENAADDAAQKENSVMQENMARDVLCRVAAQVLCKTLKRDYRWEMWTYERSSAVSRLCVMIEEKSLLRAHEENGNLSKDQIVLICSLVDTLEYGRDATGWCQLTLPTISTNDTSGDLSAASKLLLPVLQPCLRLVMSCVSMINSSQFISYPADPASEQSSEIFVKEKLLSRILAELDLTLTAAIVGLSFSSARDTALSAMAILREKLSSQRTAEDEESKIQCGALLCKISEELRERYKGERRLRDTALFDSAEESNAVERLMLGGDLFEGKGGKRKSEHSEEISFENAETENKAVSDDMVVFHEPAEGQNNGVRLGYAEYDGLGAALNECHARVNGAENDSDDRTSLTLSYLKEFLDAWDSVSERDCEESELVGLFDSAQISGDPSAPAEQSEAASEAMSTFFELAAAEKSRLKEVTHRYMPTYRHSRASFAERYCWARFSDLCPSEADGLWERGICDGNRDARSRLATFPVNPQFPRYIPKYLDHGNTDVPDSKTESKDGDSAKKRRSSVVEIDEIDEFTKNLLEAGNLEIVDITKKEDVEDTPDEDFTDRQGVDDGDDFLDVVPFHPSEDETPTRNDEPDTEMNLKKGDDALSDASDSLEEGEDDDANKSSNHNITSSAFSTPPDNASSSLGLMNSAAASLIELHIDNCLHVKAEGSRDCTLLLTRTHLILEYDGDVEGFYEGELMAAREEADRQRMIDEVGGPSGETSADDAFQLRAEKRQREIAALRPKSIRWNLSEVSHIYLRRYRLRDSSLEIFFIPTGGSAFGGYGLFSPSASIFLDFGPGYRGNERRDNAAFAIMKRTPPQAVKHWPDRSAQFIHEQLSRLTLGWVEGRVSNFDYLLHLNMLAGRSYNDICQYPVMPWVLADYTSDTVPDLTDRNSFRDLSKPVGALNPDRLEDFLERFESFADPSIPKFMYGSHYSTSAGVVLHFLVRLHPFAGLHRQLQSGHFDVADRLFSSVPRTWSMCTGSSAAEVKELTPEWYCNPAFLRNSNNFKLGTSQEGELIDDVVLPPWAKGNADKFVEVMRAALESEICSEMLPDWIDLIFGRKQQGSEAVKANNVFFYLTYYGSVDVASIEDEGLRQATELQIAHFGQCPRQLLKRSHVRRLPNSYHKLSFFQLLSTFAQKGLNKVPEADEEESTSFRKRTSLTGEMNYLPFFSAPISHWVHLDAPPPGPHADLVSLRLAGTDRCLAVDAKGIYHTFRWAWRPEDTGSADSNFDGGCFIAQRELPRFKTLPSLMYTPPSGMRPVVAISKTLFANRSVLMVLSAADAHGGLGMQLVDPVKGSVRGEVTIPAVHSGRISCIATDPIGTAAGHGGVGGELAIVGSADGNATIWRFMSSHYLPMRPRIRLSGHDGRCINGVALCATSHLAASISSHRCCLHAIGNGSVIRSFGPPDNDQFFDGENYKTKTRFADTSALAVSIQGFVLTVCETESRCETSGVERIVRSLQLFNMDGRLLGYKPLEDWRGVPQKIQCTPDGTAALVCCGRGVTLHRLSSCCPLDFLDEWQITEEDQEASNSTTATKPLPQALDLDLGPSLNRPVLAAAACSSGVLRLHALPGICAWSDRHRGGGLTQTVGSALAKPAQRLNRVMRDGFGLGKQLAGVGRDIGKEVQSDVKERGVGGFLGGVMFGKKK